MDSPTQPLPVGPLVPAFVPPPAPNPAVLEGQHATLRRLDIERDVAGLFQVLSADTSGRNWTYLSYGPFADLSAFRKWMDTRCSSNDPLFMVVHRSGETIPLGMVSFCSIIPAEGVLELGHIHLAAEIQQTRTATEALTLLLQHAFSLGYRRCEWRCNALHQGSRRAATRLGFSFEGVFRQARVVKGRNRDTAWFGMTDGDWPKLRQAYAEWLADENFDASGRQKVRLSELTRPFLVPSESVPL